MLSVRKTIFLSILSHGYDNWAALFAEEDCVIRSIDTKRTLWFWTSGKILNSIRKYTSFVNVKMTWIMTFKVKFRNILVILITASLHMKNCDGHFSVLWQLNRPNTQSLNWSRTSYTSTKSKSWTLQLSNLHYTRCDVLLSPDKDKQAHLLTWCCLR